MPSKKKRKRQAKARPLSTSFIKRMTDEHKGLDAGKKKAKLFRSNAERAALINQFHALQKMEAQVNKNQDLSAKEKQEKLGAIQHQMDELGGIEMYQDASITGHSSGKHHAFNTAKWVMAQVKALKSAISRVGSGGGGGAQESTNTESNNTTKTTNTNHNKNKNKNNTSNSNTNKNNKKKGKGTGKIDVTLSGGESWPRCMTAENEPIRLLDVGALVNHYLPFQRQVTCTAIDINPRHSSVIKADFFDFVRRLEAEGLRGEEKSRAGEDEDEDEDEDGDEDEDKGKSRKQDALSTGRPLDSDMLAQVPKAFDCIVLSLVINFVGDKVLRGRMLVDSFRLLEPGGLLFLITPNACVLNSRYVTEENMLTCLKGVGFSVLHSKLSNKLAFYMLTKQPISKPGVLPVEWPVQQPFHPKVQRKGGGFNNFSIVVEVD